jgi:hypothetical protein
VHRRTAARLLLLGLGVSLLEPVPSAAQEEIIVANALLPSIAAYPRSESGNVAPLRMLAGASAGLSAPISVALDPIHDEIIVINATNQSLTVYPRTARGDVAPLRMLGGVGTGLIGPVTALVDPFHEELVVANGFGQSITVYPRTASGTAAPIRTLAGAATGLAGPYGVTLDLVHQEIVVTNITGQSVTTYARTAGGNTAPLRTLAGGGTGLAGPRGVAVDPVHDEILVANIAGNSVTVHARSASGQAAPLRTLNGPATGLNLPVGLALDLVHDELIVVDASFVRVFARTADGNTPPLRTIAGPDTLLVTPAAVAVTTSAPLAAAVLPSSRSVQVGTPATAFAAIINAGPGPVAACGLAPITSLPVTFFFQTTEPVANTPTGIPNVPANIPPGGLQTYVFGLTPTAPLGPVDVQIGFTCANIDLAPITLGLDTLLLVASATPVPDIIAQSATVGNTGIVNVSGPTGAGAFSVATSNVGVTGTITVTADTGAIGLPVTLLVCQTNPTRGDCLKQPEPSVTLDIPAGSTPTFGVFALGSDVIPFDPAVNRVTVRFKESDVTRGATSVAIRTE